MTPDHSGQRPTAVVLDDDADIRQLIDTILTKLGFDVIYASTGAAAIDAVRDADPQIVTVDLNLPGMDGFETTKRIRALSTCYVMVVSAREEELDVLESLGLGADDYVKKPFHPRVLRARIEAMLRRPRYDIPLSASAPRPAPGARQVAKQPDAVDASQLLQHNGLTLDLTNRAALLDGKDIRLTRHEFELMRALMVSGRRVLSKADLGDMLRHGDPGSAANSRVIETHIANLRKKLGESLNRPRIIETVWRAGYRLTARIDAHV